MTQSHGTIHTMDDHLEFLYDPLLGKPVEWHMHSRNRIFGSHTDEYKVRYLSFKEKKAGESVTIDLPSECKEGSDKLKTLSGERRGVGGAFVLRRGRRLLLGRGAWRGLAFCQQSCTTIDSHSVSV